MPTSFGEKPNAEDIVKTLAEHIRGKVILVTGVSPGGLGATFVEAVAAAQPKLLILAARTTAKAEATAARVTETAPGVATRVLRLDLASQKQVRVAAADVNAYSESIDVLVNNAGIMAGPYRKSEDGIEMQFAANYIGPFLFTNLIMGKLLAAGPGARVVNVSSDGYRLGAIRYHDWNFHVSALVLLFKYMPSSMYPGLRSELIWVQDGESYNQWVAYGQSKTANLLFSQSLAHRLGSKGLYSYSLHPGVTQTNLSGDLGQADFDGLSTFS